MSNEIQKVPMFVRDLDYFPYMGLKNTKGVYISTGLPTIDYGINCLAPGVVTVVVGRSNGGKSTFVKQIIANAISSNYKVFVMNGEGNEEEFINSLYRCVIGKDESAYNKVKINLRYHLEPTQQALKALREWHKGKISIYTKTVNTYKTTDSLFWAIENELKENNQDLIIIDNLMSMLLAKSFEKNEAQAEFMQNLHDVADRYHKHIILVVHPNKEYRKENGKNLDMENISGTSDIYNKADNILSVVREYDPTKIESGINGSITVLKNRFYSDLPSVDTFYQKETGMLLEISPKTGAIIDYDFNLWGYITPDREVALPFDL